MVDCYVLIGDTNTGKSTTIRALSGVDLPRRGQRDIVWPVDFGNGPEETYIAIEGLQEPAGRSLLPSQIVSKVAGLGVNKAIIALRYKKVRNRPPAIDYIDHFINIARWAVHPPVVLGAAYTAAGCPISQKLPQAVYLRQSLGSFTIAPNGIASICRGLWNCL